MNLLENDITGSIGTQLYYAEIVWRNGVLIMDEPESQGGKDLGPDPYTTLLASLAGCTLSTLRMYVERKGWIIPEIKVKLNMRQVKGDALRTEIKREISFGEGCPADQVERLLVIAQKCPVSKILVGEIIINTNHIEF